MILKNVELVTKSLSLLLTLGMFSGCTPMNSGFMVDQSNLASELEDLSQKQTLPGTGIQRDHAAGCSVGNLSDFIELEIAHAKRVEPRNCSVVRSQTPVLSWVQPLNFKIGTTYSTQLKAESPLTNGYSETFSSKYPRQLISTPLPTGMYAWTVSYTKQDGSQAVSQARRFFVPPGSLPAAPAPEVFANTILAKSHPRVLANGATFSGIATKAKNGEYKPSFENYLNIAATYATKPIPTVPANLELKDFGGDVNKFEAWKLSLRNQIMDERLYIENLGFSFHFTGNTAHREAAIKRLQSIASWPLDGATSEKIQDQVNREILLLMAIGLDLFQDRLNEPSALEARNAMLACMKARIAQIDFDGFNRYPYNSHMLTAVLYVTEAMIYAAGTPGFATDGGHADLMKYWEMMMTTFGTWGSGTDGGFANSVGYGWYAASAMARMAAVLKLSAGINLTAWPAAGKIGEFLIAMSAPLESLRQSFGDDAENTEHYKTYSNSTARLLAFLTEKPELEWYWRLRPANITNKWLFDPIHFMLLGTTLRTPAPPTTAIAMPNSFLFEDAGYVAIHSKTIEPERSSVFFRSSRFGSFNHSHADQNAFTFVSKGKNLLISGGVYDSYLSPFHANLTRATRYKNALTFDGGIGQAEPSMTPTVPGAPTDLMHTSGRIMNFADTGLWAVATGDATPAYRGRNTSTGAEKMLLNSAYRTVAYNRRERVLVIYDRASSEIPRQWELNFQTLTSNSPAVTKDVLKITNETASGCIQVLGLPGNFAITNGFPMTPGKATADQSQIRYSSSSKTASFASVTVVKEDCREVPVRVTWYGTEARVSVNGSVISMNELVVKVP